MNSPWSEAVFHNRVGTLSRVMMIHFKYNFRPNLKQKLEELKRDCA